MQKMSIKGNGRNSPVINVTLNLNFRNIYPNVVNGQRKCAPKHAVDNSAIW
jgi:hypothetical protein